MDAQREELKRLAGLATPGPWGADTTKNDGEYGDSGPDSHSGFDSYCILDAKGGVLFDSLNSDQAYVEEEYDEDWHAAWDETAKRNAAFIAAANPQAILDLIAQLEAKEAALTESNEARHFNARMCVQLQAELTALRANSEAVIATSKDIAIHEASMCEQLQSELSALRASRDVEVERAIRLTIERAIESIDLLILELDMHNRDVKIPAWVRVAVSALSVADMQKELKEGEKK